jgi:hypothetical protein
VSGARYNYWSTRARQIQDALLDQWRGLPEEERTEQALKALLLDAYPWGERERWPYKLWLDERAVTLWRAGFRSKPVWLMKSERSYKKPPPKEQGRLDL